MNQRAGQAASEESESSSRRARVRGTAMTTTKRRQLDGDHTAERRLSSATRPRMFFCFEPRRTSCRARDVSRSHPTSDDVDRVQDGSWVTTTVKVGRDTATEGSFGRGTNRPGAVRRGGSDVGAYSTVVAVIVPPTSGSGRGMPPVGAPVSAPPGDLHLIPLDRAGPSRRCLLPLFQLGLPLLTSLRHGLLSPSSPSPWSPRSAEFRVSAPRPKRTCKSKKTMHGLHPNWGPISGAAACCTPGFAGSRVSMDSCTSL